MKYPKPFRWNIQKREQLGCLVVDVAPENEEAVQSVLGRLEEIRICSARILSHCQDSSLVFVGRSPENLFDYLSGLLEDTARSDDLILLPMSIRGRTTDEIRAEFPPSALQGMRQVLTAAGLSPRGIITGKTRYALVDVVSTGATMEGVCDFLCTWAREDRLDVSALRRNLRIVGLTERTKTSPNTWRWQQHAAWLEDYPRGFVKNVSVSEGLWRLLGNWTVKSTHSYHPGRWGSEDGAHPSREQAQMWGLHVAWRILQLGRTTDERRTFARVMAGEAGMKHAWYRALAAELAR